MEKLTNIGTFLSILGISGSSLFTNSAQGHLAFAIAILSIIYLSWRCHKAINEHLARKYEKGYKPIATFMRFSTADGKNCIYETYKHIQIKEPLAKCFKYKYYWSGTIPPKIKSSLQTVSDTVETTSDGWKSIDLAFTSPRIYDSPVIIHTHMQVDDSDEKAESYISLCITQPMQLIQFRVELLHAKSQNQSNAAYIERKPIVSNGSLPFEKIDVIKMDFSTKSYDYVIPNPEPGYLYRLRWDRIQLARTKGQARIK